MLRTALLSLAILSGLSPAHAGSASTMAHVQDKPFLDLLGSIEGPDGYNDIVTGATSQPEKPLTRMTVQEVLDYQELLQAQGSASTAVGRYQFIRKTLSYMVAKYDIDRNRLFDSHLQDSLARQMMRNCKFYDSGVPAEQVGNCLARAWAALPVLSGEKTGESHYEGVAGNKARTSREEVYAALSKRFERKQAQAIQSYKIAQADILPIIRNQKNDRFAYPIPLKP